MKNCFYKIKKYKKQVIIVATTFFYAILPKLAFADDILTKGTQGVNTTLPKVQILGVAIAGMSGVIGAIMLNFGRENSEQGKKRIVIAMVSGVLIGLVTLIVSSMIQYFGGSGTF